MNQHYIELRYDVPADKSEDVSEILVAAGASGIEERDAITIAKPAVGRVVLVVWVAAGEDEAFVARARDGLLAVVGAAASEPQREQRNEDEWRDAWKRYFHARPVGRFVIVPSWETYAAKPGEVVLDLDPGRAFGTGGHASTRLCLLAIDAIADEPARVIDVGCGSGVLAIAAARRWPRLRGVGVDIDPDSVEVSEENAQRNGVADRLRFSTTHVGQLEERAPLVLANIQPEILIPMAPSLLARMEDRATLILAGIIDEAADDVCAAYTALGTPTRLREEGWTALVYTRGGA